MLFKCSTLHLYLTKSSPTESMWWQGHTYDPQGKLIQLCTVACIYLLITNFITIFVNVNLNKWDSVIFIIRGSPCCLNVNRTSTLSKFSYTRASSSTFSPAAPGSTRELWRIYTAVFYISPWQVCQVASVNHSDEPDNITTFHCFSVNVKV